MELKANLLSLKIDRSLAAGAVFYSGQEWKLRASLEFDGQPFEGFVYLTGEKAGKYEPIEDADRCLAVDGRYKLECRVFGKPDTSTTPPSGSLVWCDAGMLLSIRTRSESHLISLDGKDARSAPTQNVFYAPRWAGWLVGPAGEPASTVPLFVCGPED